MKWVPLRTSIPVFKISAPSLVATPVQVGLDVLQGSFPVAPSWKGQWGLSGSTRGATILHLACHSGAGSESPEFSLPSSGRTHLLSPPLLTDLLTAGSHPRCQAEVLSFCRHKGTRTELELLLIKVNQRTVSHLLRGLYGNLPSMGQGSGGGPCFFSISYIYFPSSSLERTLQQSVTGTVIKCFTYMPSLHMDNNTIIVLLLLPFYRLWKGTSTIVWFHSSAAELRACYIETSIMFVMKLEFDQV